jgi:ATP-dependent Zn protease
MVERKKRPGPKERTAYHEAGHAVMHYILKKKFRYIAIDQENLPEDVAGRVSAPHSNRFWEMAEFGENEREIEKEIKIFLAGQAAETLLARRNNWIGAEGDFHKSFCLAERVYGTGETTDAYIKFLQYRVRDILQNPMHWLLIEAVAKALLEHQRLGYRKVRSIIKDAKQRKLDELQRCRKRGQ